jgi:hypothetical protein
MKSKFVNSLVVIIPLANIFLGGWSVDTILSWFGKDIPFYADAIIGLFIAELSFPIAIIGTILKAFGIF